MAAVRVDTTTAMCIEEWRKHHGANPYPVGLGDTAPDFAVRRMNEWQAQEDAWRTLVGVRLAYAALDEPEVSA